MKIINRSKTLKLSADSLRRSAYDRLVKAWDAATPREVWNNRFDTRVEGSHDQNKQFEAFREAVKIIDAGEDCLLEEALKQFNLSPLHDYDLAAAAISATCAKVTLQKSAEAKAELSNHHTRLDDTTWEKYGSKSYPRTTGYTARYFSVEIEGNAWARVEGDDLVIDDITATPSGFTRCGNAYSRTRDGMDYHANANEMVLPAAKLRALLNVRMNENKAKRKAAALAEKEGLRKLRATAKGKRVRVTFEDSRAGGNCAAGTTAFCGRHNLDAKKGVSVSALLKIAKAEPSESQKIRAAIIAAIRRTTEKTAA